MAKVSAPAPGSARSWASITKDVGVPFTVASPKNFTSVGLTCAHDVTSKQRILTPAEWSTTSHCPLGLFSPLRLFSLLSSKPNVTVPVLVLICPPPVTLPTPDTGVRLRETRPSLRKLTFGGAVPG